MKKIIAFLLLCILSLSLGIPAFAEENAVDAPSGDNLVTTKHSTVIQGQPYSYTATTGTTVVESGGGKCEVFSIAYTLDDVEDMTTRPITFVFNGGPGSASLYTNYLFMGPKRMVLSEDGHAASLPATLADNNNSILDLTDLVFIDTIGTGYSRAVDNEDNFIGYQNDIRTIGDFIRLYINRHERWGSPKYVAGESYGTIRAVGLCKYLADTWSLGLNGLMLISSANDFSAIVFSTGNELPYAAFLPTYAADAWYHGCLDEQYQNMALEEYLMRVREFVNDKYYPALNRGQSLPDEDKEAVAEKYAAFTGLSKEYVLKANLRVPLENFCTELLSDQKLMIGRYDGRYTGPVADGALDIGAYDPSSFDIDLPLTAAANQDITKDLGFQTDIPYVPFSWDVYGRWVYGLDNSFLSQEEIIYNSMAANSFLKVWVLSGYYDGATPFYGTEWVYNRVFLDDSRRDNLSFTHYPSGHMFYLDEASIDQFRQTAEVWYAE